MAAKEKSPYTQEEYYNGSPLGPMKSGVAKSILGWEEEPAEGKGFGDNYLLKDKYGKKVRCKNNPNNRPLYLNLVKEYMLEMFRGYWEFNGEPIIIDDKDRVGSGQHRLISLILAEQERSRNIDKMVEKYPHLKKNEEISIETLVIRGISSKDKVINTLDQGKRRSHTDVFYREHLWKGSNKERQQMSDILAKAVRLVWIRTGGQNVSDAPKFPISEALEVLNTQHPELIKAIEIIWNLEKSTDKGGAVKALVSVPYAAGLMYLMGASKTKIEDYIPEKPDTINWDAWDDADKFWNELVSGANLAAGSPVLALRNELGKMRASSGMERDLKVGMIVKAWQFYQDGRTDISAKDIRVKVTTKEGKQYIAEDPRIGGIDVTSASLEEKEAVAPVAKPEASKSKTPATPAVKGKTPAKPKVVKPKAVAPEFAEGQVLLANVQGGPFEVKFAEKVSEKACNVSYIDPKSNEEFLWEVPYTCLSVKA